MLIRGSWRRLLFIPKVEFLVYIGVTAAHACGIATDSKLVGVSELATALCVLVLVACYTVRWSSLRLDLFLFHGVVFIDVLLLVLLLRSRPGLVVICFIYIFKLLVKKVFVFCQFHIIL